MCRLLLLLLVAVVVVVLTLPNPRARFTLLPTFVLGTSYRLGCNMNYQVPTTTLTIIGWSTLCHLLLIYLLLLYAVHTRWYHLWTLSFNPGGWVAVWTVKIRNVTSFTPCYAAMSYCLLVASRISCIGTSLVFRRCILRRLLHFYSGW